MVLAHMKGGTAGRYSRAEHLEQRRKLMQDWSDYAASPAVLEGCALRAGVAPRGRSTYDARSTPVSGRRGRRPWCLQWANKNSRTAKRRWWAARRFAQLNFRRPEVLNRGRSGKPSRTTMRPQSWGTVPCSLIICNHGRGYSKTVGLLTQVRYLIGALLRWRADGSSPERFPASLSQCIVVRMAQPTRK